jgi:hypothetical protein
MYCDDRATPTPVSSCISLGGQCYASSENPNNYAGYTCDKLSASDCNCYSCHKKTDAELTCYERGMYDSVAQCQQSDYGRCTSSYGKTCDVDIATGCAYCHTYASEPTATPTVPASSTHDCEVSCRDKNCKNKPDNQQNDCFQYCSNYCGGSSSAPTATPRPVSKVEKCKSECNGYKDCECHCEGLCYNYSVYVDKCIVCGTPAPYAKQPTATPTPAPESGSGNAPSDGSYDCQYDPVNENYICN